MGQTAYGGLPFLLICCERCPYTFSATPKGVPFYTFSHSKRLQSGRK